MELKAVILSFSTSSGDVERGQPPVMVHTPRTFALGKGVTGRKIGRWRGGTKTSRQQTDGWRSER